MSVWPTRYRRSTALGLTRAATVVAWCLGGILPVAAQHGTVTITGTVVDAQTGLPLEHAHVFIASSMIGTATNAAGIFQLSEVPEGAHRLFISMIGYDSAERDSLFRAPRAYHVDIQLAPTVVTMSEIVVNAREARRWQRRLLKFERMLIGETDNAAFTKILNPEVLSFSSRWGKFTASAAEPLVIENTALGYRMQYFLKEFESSGGTIKWDGEPLFTELEPDSGKQAAMWESNRRKAFLGSMRHLMLTLLGGRWAEEGFEISRRLSPDQSDQSFRVDPATLLRNGPTPQEKELAFHGYLEVVYANEEEAEAYGRWLGRSSWRHSGFQRSLLRLNDGPTLIDQSGEVIDPYGVIVYGYFAFERVGDEIPKEYRPSNWRMP